jgi:hypothetical protein
MTSLQTRVRQLSSDDGYFIPVGDCRGKVYAYNGTANTFAVAQWASTGYANASTVTSTLQAGQSILRDLGKTVVSSSRTFRKVQLVVSTAVSSFGVGGPATGTNPIEDYLTGYIEIGFSGPTSTPAPVAKYGR